MIFSTFVSPSMFLTVLFIIVKNENLLTYILKTQLNNYAGICSHNVINI